MTARVLIIDDDTDVAATIADILQDAGYQTIISDRGADALAHIETGKIELALVDLKLPDMDGLEIVKRLDRRHNVGVIIVSGRSDGIDRVVGLELGADDYVTKPFDARELLARVRSVLRRCARLDSDGQPRAVSFGPWSFDQLAREVRRADGTNVPLTPTEYRLLNVLVSHANRVLTRERIMDLLYQHDADAPFDRSVDVTIARLRRKLETDPGHPTLIRTVRGEGYLFDLQPVPA